MGAALRMTGTPGAGTRAPVCAVAACGGKAGFATEELREDARPVRLATRVPG